MTKPHVLVKFDQYYYRLESAHQYSHCEIENAFSVWSQLHFELPALKIHLGVFTVFDPELASHPACQLLPHLPPSKSVETAKHSGFNDCRNRH